MKIKQYNNPPLIFYAKTPSSNLPLKFQKYPTTLSAKIPFVLIYCYNRSFERQKLIAKVYDESN
ncbi:hypothetical protein HpHA31_03530 [Helicobacter pylori]